MPHKTKMLSITQAQQNLDKAAEALRQAHQTLHDGANNEIPPDPAEIQKARAAFIKAMTDLGSAYLADANHADYDPFADDEEDEGQITA